MKLFSVTAISVAVLAALPALADDASHSFIPVGWTNNMITFLDTKTIETRGDSVIVWTIYAFDSIQTVDGVEVQYTINREQFSCKSRTSVRLDALLYDTNGVPLDMGADLQPPQTVTPDSVGEEMLDAACGGWRSSKYTSVSDVATAVAVAKQVLRSPVATAQANTAPQ